MGARTVDALSEVLDAPIGAHLTRPDTRIEDADGWYRVVTPSYPQPNEVIRARIAPAQIDAAIDRVIGEYRALGVPFKWIVAADSEPEEAIARALEARGLTTWLARGMAFEPGSLAISAPAAIETRRAEGDLEAYSEVIARGWDLDAATYRADYRRAIASGLQPRLFLALEGGVPIGAAAYVKKARSAYFTSAVVLPEHRGKGAYRALVAARLAACAEEGVPLAITQAREATSAPILERVGFTTVCRLRVFAG